MPAIDWNEEDLLRLSKISDDDLALFFMIWETFRAPRDRRIDLRDLSAPLPRRALDRMISNVIREIQTMSDELRAGGRLDRFQVEMAEIVRYLNTIGAFGAFGGIEIFERYREETEELIYSELGYLAGFAKAIQSGEQLLDGRLFRRASLYANAARKTYHSLEAERMKEEGFEL